MRITPYIQFKVSLLGCILVSSMLMGAITQTTVAQTTPEAIQNYNLGFELYGQNQTLEALKKFDLATKIDPGYADAYYNMASIYYQMGHYGEAADMFQKSVNLSPGDNLAKYNLALCLEKMSHFDEAVNILSQIPPSDPKFAQAKAKIEELRPSLKPHKTVPAKPAAVVEKPKPAATTQTSKPAPAAKPAAWKKMESKAFSKGYDGPTGITIGPGGFMYVANYSKNQIYRVGANGEKTVFAQGTGLKGPIGIVYNPKTNELYVANYLLNNVARINASGKVAVLVSGLSKPYNLFLDAINNTLYVSEQDPVNLISKVALP